MQVLVCVCVSVFSVSVYTLRSSVLVLYCVLQLGLLYSFQGFLLPLLSLCPPTPCLLPYIRVNNSGQAETDKPPQGPLICTGVKEHIFSLRPLPDSTFLLLSLWLCALLCTKVLGHAHICESELMCLQLLKCMRISVNVTALPFTVSGLYRDKMGEHDRLLWGTEWLPHCVPGDCVQPS